MGLLVDNDSHIMQQFFKEMCLLRGIPVEYIHPVEETITIHGEIQPKFSSIHNINVIFETNPKIKTLKNIGWISEDSKDKPYVAYLSYDTPYLQSKCRIKILPRGPIKEGRWFEITDITEGIEFPDAYMCKLAPIMKYEEPKLDYDQTNNNYIEGDNQPDESVNHFKEINKDLEQHIEDNMKKTLDDNFNYLKM